MFISHFVKLKRKKEKKFRRRLTSSTEASYISTNFSERGTSLMSKFTPAKLSWRAAYIPRSWHKKQTATSQMMVPLY